MIVKDNKTYTNVVNVVNKLQCRAENALSPV